MISLYLMKFVVVLTSFPARFAFLHHVLDSWHRQSVPVESIFVAVSTTDPRYGDESMATLKEYAVTYPKTKIITLCDDFGPHNKMLGALSCPRDPDAYVLVCDDDISYGKETVEYYQSSLNERKLSPLGTEVLTHFRTSQRIPGVPHVQGADTYLLPPLFFQRTTYERYREYLVDTMTRCPEAFYQDDYVVSYYFVVHCGLDIEMTRQYPKYSSKVFIEPLSRHPDRPKREKKTTDYFRSLRVKKNDEFVPSS